MERFTCGERKMWQNIKKSQNIMRMIVVEECTKSTYEIRIVSKNQHKNKCRSYTLYNVLFSIIFTVSIGITIYFVYSHSYFKNDDARVMLDTRSETTIY